MSVPPSRAKNPGRRRKRQTSPEPGEAITDEDVERYRRPRVLEEIDLSESDVEAYAQLQLSVEQGDVAPFEDAEENGQPIEPEEATVEDAERTGQEEAAFVDVEAYEDLNRRLLQNVVQKLHLVVRLYLNQSLTIVKACRALIQQCSEGGVDALCIEELRGKIIPLARDAVSAASHLYIPSSSFLTPSAPGVEAARLAFDTVSVSLTKLITISKIPDLKAFEAQIRASQIEDRKKAAITCRGSARLAAQLLESRRGRFLQTCKDDWSSFR